MVILLYGALLVVQAEAVAPSVDPGPANVVRATRASVPPVLDGLDDDPVWRVAPRINRFFQARPSEGAAPSLGTEVRVGYDAHNLYVFVRSFDPHPDSIASPLSRRDVPTQSDLVTLMIDSYHDRRTGFQFTVNPAGVQTDVAIYNDGDEDVAWDAIWDAKTRVDSLGWTVEYRIPLSQLRYSRHSEGTFGFLVQRVIRRYTETVSWPLYRLSRSGLTSQFGELTGLDSLGRPGRAELTPYLVTKSVEGPASSRYARDQEFTAGGDVKLRLASNLLLNATVNPDFGQVEADPSVLNLSAFETFRQEQRPFFVEGKGIFDFRVNCVVVNDCSTGEGLFYSRRLGRSPQLSGVYPDDASAGATRILGAAKLTGRLPGGFSLGVLDAVTDRVAGPGGRTIEPAANYAVLRGSQDFDQGNGSVGFILTGVNRSLDASSKPYLHRSAYTGGIDARRRFGGRYELSGSFDVSRVAGTAQAIARTQRSSVHLYQRPDDPLRLDTTRTSLSGTNLELRFAKVGGRRLVFETAYQRRSAGFDINDVGFLLQADQQWWSTWANVAFREPNRVFREVRWNFNNWEFWSADGLLTELAFNTNIHTQLNNRWWLHLGGTLGQLGTTYCDRCARGGPAIRQDPYIRPWAGIEGDGRKKLVPYLFASYFRGDQGRSESVSLSPTLELKVSSRFTTSLSGRWGRDRKNAQYYGTLSDSLTSAPHYAFARLDQKSASLTWRLGYTFTPTASLQIYASPFIAKGTYSRLRELERPRAARYRDRYQPYPDPVLAADPGGFNYQEFRSNVVFRWEYRPGSTLFLVWSQGRQSEDPREGSRSLAGDLGHLFDRRADDTFLIKVSYWLAR